MNGKEITSDSAKKKKLKCRKTKRDGHSVYLRKI